jgi:pseudouridine kinase
MSEEGHVLVIGAAGMDIKGRPDQLLVRGSSTPGRIRTSAGGVARNIAENLARLDVETVLLTAVGDDLTGEYMLGQAAASGIDVSSVLIAKGQRTGTYVALLNRDGSLDVAIDDMNLVTAITPRYLTDRQELFQDARMAVMDANLTPQALETVVQLCRQYNVPLCADPTSTALAPKLLPHLSQLYMISPNAAEAQVLSGAAFGPRDRDEAQTVARQFITTGVGVAIIALAEFGVVYANADGHGHVPALKTRVLDATGAGDALTATIIFGLLEEIPLDECVRLGVTAAALTLRSHETVRPDLTQELLYDELVI